MHPCKPLYPLPWWSVGEALPPICEEQFPREDFIVRYVGTDCEGNALFCVKRRRPPCSPQPSLHPRCNIH